MEVDLRAEHLLGQEILRVLQAISLIKSNYSAMGSPDNPLSGSRKRQDAIEKAFEQSYRYDICERSQRHLVPCGTQTS